MKDAHDGLLPYSLARQPRAHREERLAGRGPEATAPGQRVDVHS
jgi:hypothetical protein